MGIAGALVFGGLLVMTFSNQAIIERAAGAFLMSRVEHEIGAQLGLDTPAPFVDFVLRGIPGKAKELRVVGADRLREALRSPPATEEERIVEVGGGIYRQLLDDLIHELRVFAGCNCVVFALTIVLAGWRREDAPSLLVPAAILGGAGCLAIVSYLVAQNWFFAFLTSNYAGYGYLLVLAVAASLLADIAFNRARLTSVILRALWHWSV